MPSRIAERREEELEERLDHLRREIDRFSEYSISDDFNAAFSEILAGFDEIAERKSDAEENQNDYRLYQRYLAKVLSTEAEIAQLERVLTFLELHAHHKEQSRDVFQRVEAICDEVVESFGLTVTTYPVLQEDYSLLPLLDDQYYVVFVPRGRELLPTIPILAHEIAHSVLDRTDARSAEFVDRFKKLRDRMSSEQAERDFHQNWDHWYDELFCDILGFYAFGPSYVCSQLHHLLTGNPYRIDRDIGVENETLHPPNALRVDLITDLAEEHLPQELYEELEPLRTEYSEYLASYSGRKPSVYDEWVDDQLVEAVVADTGSFRRQFDDLCSHLLGGTDPEDAPAFEHRIRANRHWLDPA